MMSKLPTKADKNQNPIIVVQIPCIVNIKPIAKGDKLRLFRPKAAKKDEERKRVLTSMGASTAKAKKTR